jgi:hypothetical protein
MMELLFNTAWFAVVVVAIVALLRKRHRTTVRVRLLLALGALVCAAVVVFPSISVSDDLHFNAFIIEDSKSTRRLTQSAALANLVSPLLLLPITFSTFLVFAFWERRWRVTEHRAPVCRDVLFNRNLLGRAPPSYGR